MHDRFDPINFSFGKNLQRWLFRFPTFGPGLPPARSSLPPPPSTSHLPTWDVPRSSATSWSPGFRHAPAWPRRWQHVRKSTAPDRPIFSRKLWRSDVKRVSIFPPGRSSGSTPERFLGGARSMSRATMPCLVAAPAGDLRQVFRNFGRQVTSSQELTHCISIKPFL